MYHIDLNLGTNELGDQSVSLATQNMIDYANSKGKRIVINMSIGLGSRDYAFENLVANNQNKALFVIASGNSGQSSIAYPAILANIYSNVIAVGAANSSGQRINYSQYGVGLTLMGPSEVISTRASSLPYPYNTSNTQFGYYSNSANFNGTSAAAPNVAGVASLVWSANQNLTASGVKQILSQTAVDLGTPGYDYVYGSGFVNADAAVRRALAIKRTGSFSIFSSLSLNDGLLNELNTLSVNSSQSTLFTDSQPVAQNQFIEMEVIETVEMNQFIPVYSVSENSLTPLTNVVSVAGLDNNFSDTLAPGLQLSSSVVQNADDLMLVYS